jgi:hypothetical protein
LGLQSPWNVREELHFQEQLADTTELLRRQKEANNKVGVEQILNAIHRAAPFGYLEGFHSPVIWVKLHPSHQHIDRTIDAITLVCHTADASQA